MTASELYEKSIRPLPAAERLSLAKLIISDLAPSSVDEGDHWSDEDLRDFTASGWRNADAPAEPGGDNNA